MNYRDFYKKSNNWKRFKHLIPEGVDPKEFEMGLDDEKGEHHTDEFQAAKIAGDHLKQDKHYYSKLKKAGLEEKELLKGINLEDKACDDGFPKREDGSLNAIHDGRPIHLSKIIQVGGEFSSGKPASGELGGYTSVGGERMGHSDSVDSGGVKVNQDGDKEPITAGGKSVDPSLASKTVGSNVVSGEGQKQGGPNTKGNIAGTKPIEGGDGCGCDDMTLSLQEAKSKLKYVVKEVLKEITFDKKRGKWVKLNEGHKAGCECGFCKNKGTFGKKKDKKEDKEDVDENVDMKMGPSHKVAPNPTLQTPGTQDLPRIQSYEPSITEMLDDEQEECMQERYESLVNAQRNLSESELQELKDLGSKLSIREDDAVMKMGPSYRVVAPRQCRTLGDDTAHRNQDTPNSTNEAEEQEEAGLTSEAGGGAVQHSSARVVPDGNLPQLPKNRHRGDIDENTGEPSKYVGSKDKSRCKRCGKVSVKSGGTCKCK